MTSMLKKVKTSDGKELMIPILGLGTYDSSNSGLTYESVKLAIELGYRLIDCAYLYDNEAEVGKAIKESIDSKKVKREELFIVSKVWATFTRPDRVPKCMDISLKRLGLPFIDLYLVHWPLGFEQQDKEMFPKDKNGLIIEDKTFDLCKTWKAMEELVTKGLTKSIGLSNCNSKQVEQVLASAKIKPLLNQIEIHPYNANTKLIEFCRSKGVLIGAYSPLGGQRNAVPGQKVVERKEAIDDPLVKKLAEKYKKNKGQILLRFGIDRGYILAAKTSSKEKQFMVSNIQIFDFQLTKDEIKQLEDLNCGFRSCTFDIPDVPKWKSYPFKKDIEF